MKWYDERTRLSKTNGTQLVKLGKEVAHRGRKTKVLAVNCACRGLSLITFLKEDGIRMSELCGKSKMQNLSSIFDFASFHPSRIRCASVLGKLRKRSRGVTLNASLSKGTYALVY